MKKFDKKDVYSWSNAEKAKQYINKQGYFGDSIAELNNKIQGAFKNILRDIFAGDTDRASFPFGNDDEETWGLFLPVEKVKEVEEKKWRPFKSIDEFQKETGFDLLSIVHYRLNPSRSITSKGCGVITEFNTSGSDKNDYITIGDTSFNLNELFNYEYLDKHGKWQPFGVIDES